MRKISKIWLLGTCFVLCGAALALAGCRRTPTEQGTTNEKPETVFGEWVTTLEATCEEEGLQMRVSLADSSVVETRPIPAKGHEWSDWAEETAPTCIVDGVKARVCSVCENKDYAPIPKHGHDWGEWETGKEATCLTGGYDIRVCKYDEKHLDIQATEALGHDWGEWVVFVAPTCTQVGSERCVCRNDNHHVQVQVLEALGHDWNEAVVTKEPTCDLAGESTQICRNDKAHKQTEEIPALDHDWSEWVLTKAPTATEDGEESRYCSNSDEHPQTRTVPFLGTEGLTFVLNGEDTGYIVSGKSLTSVKELYIPAMHDGLPVTEIADNAFQGCTSLKKVVFGGSIVKIGNYAFASCTALEHLGIPESVTEIGARAFAGSNIKAFHIPASVQKVGANAFEGWQEEQTIFVAGFANAAEADEAWVAWQSGCNALITYETGDDAYGANLTFTKIGNGEVSVCASTEIIGAITIPEVYKGLLVKEIEANGFAGCTSVTNITLPASLTEIGDGAFDGWIQGQTITVRGYATEAEADAALGTAWREGCNATILYEKEQYLPEGTRAIEAGAFSGNTTLLQIVIPDSVTSVGAGAFNGWTEEQTIFVKGFDSELEADNAWGEEWRQGCNAEIIYGA